MTHPHTLTALEQDLQHNFTNYRTFRHALFINYAVFPRIIVWFGLIIYLIGLVFFSFLAIGSHIAFSTLFDLLYLQIVPVLAIPFSFTPASIIYWCVTVWELAVLYEIIEKIIREVKIHSLFNEVQTNQRLLKVGYAYELNAHEMLIVNQDPIAGEFRTVLAKLPLENQKEWYRISHIIEGRFGFQRATNYDIKAIRQFLSKHFSHLFTFFDVLPSIGSLPFYWKLTDFPADQAVFYFSNDNRKPIYVLQNFTATGHKLRKSLKQVLVENLLVFLYW